MQVLFLLSLAASRWVRELLALLLLVSSLGLPCSSLPSWFSGEALVFRSSSPFLFSVAVSSGFLWALLRPSSACVPFGLFGCASLILLVFLPVLVLSLSLHALLLIPFLCMPSVSSVISWLEHFLQLVALFLLLLARPTLLSLPFRLLILVLPFVRVGCMGLRRLGFSPQCSFGFLPCGPFLIVSLRLSSFSHSDVQFSSSCVYDSGSLLAEGFCTLGFTCGHL